MNQFMFFGAFLTIGIPMSFWLASYDSEPDMAGLSLLIFCFVGTGVSLLAYIMSCKKFRYIPSALNGVFSGAIAAALFFLALSFVHKNFNFWYCLLGAFTLSVSLAAISPFIVKKCLTHHSSGTPNGAP